MLEKEKINFEKTAIVGIVTQNQSEEKLSEYLDELEFLTFTAGGQVVKRFWQKMDKPNPKTFLGTGKIDEIHLFVKARRNFLCQNAGRIGTMHLFVASPFGFMDALRTTKRRNRDAWSGRNRDRNRQTYCS